MKKSTEILRGHPIVACVGKNYIISVPVRKEVLMRIRVGAKDYYFHSNGVRISNTHLQRFTIPADELNRERRYSVFYNEVILRKAYFCALGKEQRADYVFRPVSANDPIKIYHISDTHGKRIGAVNAAEFFGKKPDLLILNGDISSSSSTEEELMLQFDIASDITQGEIPCVITRGNHDLRGAFAEKAADYLPVRDGKTYYSATIGSLWLLILDCGEDKEDGHREYSSTVCCHEMRIDETRYIKDIVNNASDEYDAPGIRHKIIISHVPFEFNNTECCKGERPFDIEHGIYGEWCSIIREKIKPDFMLCGHIHDCAIWSNGKNDNKNIGIPVIIGGNPKDKISQSYEGCALELQNGNVKVNFTDDKLNIIGEYNIGI